VARPPSDRQRRVDARTKRQLVEFDNYEESVSLISSFEQWLAYHWGPRGAVASTLQRFDRFPTYDGLRPDFAASFQTGYLLWGEVMRTFRRGKGARNDLEQLMSYSRYLHPSGRFAGPSDLLLLVGTHADDIAATAVAAALEDHEAGRRPQGPIVIVGYFRDTRANGEWFDLKWRSQPGNSRFSQPNVVAERNLRDLNSEISRQQHCPIRLDLAALNIATGNPFTNDDPPPLYTIVRAIYPAISQILTEDERDELQAVGRVEKRFSRESLMSAECIRSIGLPARYIQSALEHMVDRRLARGPIDVDPPEYAIDLDVRTIGRDLKQLLGGHIARVEVADLLRKLRRATRRVPDRQSPLPLDG